ncbi:2OG-Fe dioxygenase family protein [Streptomyces sp. NPDC006208]|uniref:2OG-Fe dioxygenase family protein n=1 Tax=Streptomyces sp. NPDC006208 TaxID=3156734 RepID=UPI0033B99DF9
MLDVKRKIHPLLSEHRATIDRQRWTFVPAAETREILAGLAVSQAAMDEIGVLSDLLRSDPTLPFRAASNGRFCTDFGTRQAYRTEDQLFVLTAEEDFHRFDSGQLRVFDPLEARLCANAAFQGLLTINAFILATLKPRHRPLLDYTSDQWITTVFDLRTITTPELIGEPALEGVHSDGVDLSMTTFLSRNNMRRDSGITDVHEMAQVNGVRWDEIDPQYRVGTAQHWETLDILIVVDHEKKHSVSPLWAEDPTQRATRDVLTFFSRKPTVEGHVSYDHDSRLPHESLPCQVDVSIVRDPWCT